jgi:hypothetical protein
MTTTTEALTVTTCYVRVAHGPNASYKKWERDGKPEAIDLATFKASKPVRVGAYGDPAAFPFETWETLAKNNKLLGYTHQWREVWFDPRHLELFMASVNSSEDRAELKRRYPTARTYRVMKAGETPEEGEIECPWSTRKVQCADCGLCDATIKAKDIAARAI